MTKTQEERLILLYSMGLRFNGDSYVGMGENSDVNFHHIEIMTDSDDVWNEKIDRVKTELRNRELDEII